MIIVGAKGFAKEILQIISIDLNYKDQDILFFDNVNSDLPELLYSKFKILKTIKEVKSYFEETNDFEFTLGLGNPKMRHDLFEKFVNLGGIPITVRSKKSEVGSFDVHLKEGTSILSGARISNSVKLGRGCIVYYNSIITHDCKIGDFVEISPNATILGRCKIGDYTSIGAASVILPDIIIGKNVTVGAGTVVLNNVPDNSVIVGVPGKIISNK